jgi:mannose-6-phosphate isomerase-like protein (cupin superfamily)
MGTIINLAQAPARPAGGGATEAVLVGDSRQIAASLLRLSGGGRYIGEVPRGSDHYLFVLDGTAEFEGPAGTKAAMGRRGFAIVEEYVADTVTPRHHHPNAESMFVLLEGRLRFLVNGEEHILAPGQATHFPMNDSHALRSADGQALNFLEFHIPGVFRPNYDG